MTQTRSASPLPLRHLPKRQYYRHSGIVPPMGIAAGLGGGLLCAVLAALVYAYADLYMPIIYGNFLLTVGFGAFAAYAPARLLHAAKVRNTAVVWATVGVVTLAAYYFCWIFWLYALFQKASHPINFLAFVNHPRALLLLIPIINESGTWSFGHIGSTSTPVSGIVLWFVWATEAAVIFLVAFKTTRAMASARIFCEKCACWSAPAKIIAKTAAVSPGDLQPRLEAGDFTFVPTLPHWDGRPGIHYRWEIHQCKSCKELNTLTVSSVDTTINKKNTSTKIKKLVETLILQPGDIQAMTTPPPAPVNPAAANLPGKA